MAQSKHTPGPWRTGGNELSAFNVYGPTGDLIAQCLSTANARLIAAAPELLAALQMALPALEWCDKQWANSPQRGHGVNVLHVVKATIAKAEAAS